MGTQVHRSIRLSPFNASTLDRSSGESGGIIYDQTNQTLRINNGSTNGGTILATRSWVSANSFSGNYNSLTNKPTLFSGDYNDLSNKPTIPSLTGYATETYVNTAINGISIPSLTGYATETYVNTAINGISIPSLTGYATETYVNTAISQSSYSLPQATNLILGGVKVDNTTITASNGIISATAYSLPTASQSTLGGVKIDNSSITISSGTISVPAVATIGQASGIASLGSDGKLLSSQIPSSLSGAIVFKGTWNANTNTPSLADGVGTNGWEYAVSVGGTRDLGSGNITFTAGDYIIYNGTIWQQIPSSTIAAAGTLTGTTLNATVVNSSLTSVGTLTNLTVTNTITGSVSGNAGTVTNGVVTTGSYSDPSWLTLTAGKVGLGNVTNESKATMFTSPTFTGTATIPTLLTATGGFSITQSGTKLLFKYNGVTVASMDSSGNIISAANVTAYGAP